MADNLIIETWEKTSMHNITKHLKINGKSLIIGSLIIITLSFFIKASSTPTASYQSISYDLAYGALQSILASIIFYYFLVYLPEINRKNHMRSFIGKRSWNIIGDAHAIYTDMAKAAEIKTDFKEATPEEITQICELLAPNGKAPLVINRTNPFQYANWLYYLLHRKNRSINFTEKLFKYISFLDTEHIRLLTEISDCNYFSTLEMIYNIAGVNHYTIEPIISNKNISILSTGLIEYFDNIKKLERHLKSTDFPTS